jgi:hypothetical protein
MLQLLAQMFLVLGTYASLVSTVWTIRDPGRPVSSFHLGLVGLATLLLLVAFGNEVRAYVHRRPRLLRGAVAIRDYMYRWISHDGRVAIFSRDLSWVRDQAMRDLLLSKARRDELSIFVPRRIPLTEELEGAGAKICDYPDLDYTPQARFTIIRRGRQDPAVAVGRTIGGRHRIDEFSVGEHPVFFVANDLVEIVERLSDARHGPRGGRA